MLKVAGILYGKTIELNLSGNEVDYSNYLILLVKNMLCSKHHCQKGVDFIVFSYKIRRPVEQTKGPAKRDLLPL